MKVAVIGSRTFTNVELLYNVLDDLNKVTPIKLIISGGAAGADSFAEHYAKKRNIKTTIFYANWNNITHPEAVIKYRYNGIAYDALAGFRRNKTIVKAADLVIAFWDGKSRGTKQAIEVAKELGKQVNIINF